MDLIKIYVTIFSIICFQVIAIVDKSKNSTENNKIILSPSKTHQIILTTPKTNQTILTTTKPKQNLTSPKITLEAHDKLLRFG